MKQALHPLFTLLLLSFLLALPACDDEPTSPEDPRIPPLPAPTAPESLIAALQVIYNDTVRSALERRDAYGGLLLEGNPPTPGFLFRFQPADVGTDPGNTGAPIPPSWGRDEEIRAHEGLFSALEDSTIYALFLQIQHTEAEEIVEVGKEDWKRVFAFHVYLRLMFNPNDGLEVDGGQAEFDCAPVAGRWYIGEWKDLPRPFASGPRLAVEPATWGRIKANFRLRQSTRSPGPSRLGSRNRPGGVVR